MKRVVLAVIAVALGLLSIGALPASSAPPATAPAAPRADGIPSTLRVGTEGVYPPFSFHNADNQLTGFDIDVMN